MNRNDTGGPADDQRAYRGVLGRFATGVTVVTAPGPDGPAAITANSFASVSLDPPLVLWSPAKASRRFELFRDAPRFVIHVLAADQAGLARHFARTGHDFRPADWHEGPGGLPLLTHFAARFTCTQHAVHDGGDHVVILGRVDRAEAGDAPPLVFSDGRYGRFAPGE